MDAHPKKVIREVLVGITFDEGFNIWISKVQVLNDCCRILSCTHFESFPNCFGCIVCLWFERLGECKGIIKEVCESLIESNTSYEEISFIFVGSMDDEVN